MNSDNLRTMQVFPSGVLSIDDAAIVPEVQYALGKWLEQLSPKYAGVLVGGLALSFYCQPRYTQDIDILFLDDIDVPSAVTCFKNHRTNAFQETRTHVEVEILMPNSIGIPHEVAKQVYKTAVNLGMRVASLEGIIVLKLYASRNKKRYNKDVADIISMLAAGLAPAPDLHDWHLPEDLKATYEYAITTAKE